MQCTCSARVENCTIKVYKELVLKRYFKKLTDTVCILIVIPIYFIYQVLALPGGRDGVFWSFSQMFSLLPGKTGNYLRKNFYRLTMSSCHPDCAILFGTLFSQIDTEIGKGVYIGPNCNIGKCRIESYCTIGSNVHIMSGKRQHRFDDPDLPVQRQGGVFEKVTIGEDTWIGNCALVMANIGKKCIVGAGSVVTREVPDFSIVAGNPARVIGFRENSE